MLQVFRSVTTGKLKEDESVFLKNEFGAGVPVYWMGSYVDLEMQATPVAAPARADPAVVGGR